MSERGSGVGLSETLRLRLVVNRRLVELLAAPPDGWARWSPGDHIGLIISA